VVVFTSSNESSDYIWRIRLTAEYLSGIDHAAVDAIVTMKQLMRTATGLWLASHEVWDLSVHLDPTGLELSVLSLKHTKHRSECTDTKFSEKKGVN